MERQNAGCVGMYIFSEKDTVKPRTAPAPPAASFRCLSSASAEKLASPKNHLKTSSLQTQLGRPTSSDDTEAHTTVVQKQQITKGENSIKKLHNGGAYTQLPDPHKMITNGTKISFIRCKEYSYALRVRTKKQIYPRDGGA